MSTPTDETYAATVAPTTPQDAATPKEAQDQFIAFTRVPNKILRVPSGKHSHMTGNKCGRIFDMMPVCLQNAHELERIEEEKLKSKYPTGFRGPGGHSAFLQKRLQKGQKFFDSGDYQMAKQKGGGVKQVFANKVTTGEAIPTPETVPARKTSIIQPCNKFSAAS